MINYAGVGDEALFYISDASRLKKIIDLNITTVVNLTNLFIQNLASNLKGQFVHVNKGDDDLLNRIILFSVKGNTPCLKNMTLPLKLRKDDDD